MSPDTQLTASPPRVAAVLPVISSCLVAVGAIAFFMGVNGSQPLRTWQAYLFNYLYWTSISSGGVLFVAVLNMTSAVWARPIKRLAEGLAAFLPVSFLLFWVLYPAREQVFPWAAHPPPEKAAWLSLPFLFARDGAAHLLLTLVALALVFTSVRADRAWRTGATPAVTDRGWRTQVVLSPILGITYAFVLSLLAVDLVMTLDPVWYSTMFPGYFFVGAFYMAVAALYLVVLLYAGPLGIDEFLHPREYHDLGKLTMAFCLFTGYVYYAQFLVIWYGNLPDETSHIITRVKLEPWAKLSWAVLFMIFVIPFATLLSRRVKLLKVPMVVLTVMILVGMWLERFLLVVPSLWKEGGIPIGITEILVGLGFLGLVSLCFFLFLMGAPLLPVSDPLFHAYIRRNEARLEP